MVFVVIPTERSDDLSWLPHAVAPACYFFFLPAPLSDEDWELSEFLDDSEDFESEDLDSDVFDSPGFSFPFEAAPSPELSAGALSGFFPA